MKKKQPKFLLAQLIPIILVIPIIVKGIMPSMPRYMKYLQRESGKNYNLNCLLIDMHHVIQGLGLLIYYRTTHKKKNLGQAINVIKKQLQEFEAWLLQEEQNALIIIKNKFNIDDAVWNTCLTDIQALKTLYTQRLQQAYPTTTHDENIPTDLLSTITTMLLNNNIAPQSINIKMIDTDNNNTLMQVRSYTERTIDSCDNRLIISKQYQPLTLEIFPAMKNSTITQQKIIALCAHEVQHIIQHHGLSLAVLTTYLQHYCALDNTTVTACPEFQKFIQIQEAQAELLSAIKNHEIAHCLRGYRATTYYPHYLLEDHYYNISSVDMLWKINAWLTWCHQFSIANKKNDLTTKMHHLADSFKQLVSHS